MGKLLFFVLLAATVWWLMKGTRRPQAKAPVAEDMVRCAQCGVHLPRSESHTSDGKFFCSVEHLRLHR